SLLHGCDDPVIGPAGARRYDRRVSEVMAAPTVPEDDPLARGRAALDRHDWAEGYELLVAADRIQPLSGSDLEQLALAAFFVPQPEHLGELKERAFKAHLDA